jgi:hypothetical protein
MAAADATPVPRKNVAYRVTFPILDADGDLVTGAATLDSEVSINGAAFADAISEATEIATASGVYFLDLTAGEMNGDTVAVIVKTSTAGAKTTVIVMYPEEAGDYRASVVAGGITAASFAAGAIDAAAIAANAIGASELAADAVTEIQAGLSTLDAAGVRAAVGLAFANLDTQLATIDDFLDTEIAAILAAVDTEIAAIKTKTDSLTFTVANQVDANQLSTNGDATATAQEAKATRAIGRGTVAAGGTTTSVPTSAFVPNGAAADQFKGRIITFDADTTTAALRGQATDITASSNAAAPTFTVTALTTAPASGDTFSVT